MRIASMALCLLLVGCGGDATNDGAGGASSGGGSPGGGSGGTGGTSATGGTTATGGSAGAQDCLASGSGSLGIQIQLTEPVRCEFTLAEAAAGISIGYQVVIDADVSDVVPEAQTTCATALPSGLFVFEQLSGSGQSYCICDSGLCPSPSDTPVTLKAGTYPGSFAWDGKNWSGPSDTGNPKGPAFPAGSYQLALSAKGKHAGTAFDVHSGLTVTLVP